MTLARLIVLKVKWHFSLTQLLDHEQFRITYYRKAYLMKHGLTFLLFYNVILQKL